jgi:hypothetical protein
MRASVDVSFASNVETIRSPLWYHRIRMRRKLCERLRPLGQLLVKVRRGRPSSNAARPPVPSKALSEHPCVEVTLRSGDRRAGTFVEIVTYASEAEIARWERDPDGDVRGTGLTWRSAVPAKKKRRAA